MRARNLFTHADAWMGRSLTVDVYEPLYDSEDSSAANPGQVAVEVEDVGTGTLDLVPARNAADRHAGALDALPDGLAPPIRVLATLGRDDRRQTSSGRVWLLLVVHRITPLPFPEPAHLAHADDILADPARWSGRYVEVEDEWLSGFEASYLGHDVWLDFYPSATVLCAPPSRPGSTTRRSHVDVRGFAYTKGRYQARGLIVATGLVYLNPSRPACRGFPQRGSDAPLGRPTDVDVAAHGGSAPSPRHPPSR